MELARRFQSEYILFPGTAETPAASTDSPVIELQGMNSFQIFLIMEQVGDWWVSVRVKGQWFVIASGDAGVITPLILYMENNVPDAIKLIVDPSNACRILATLKPWPSRVQEFNVETQPALAWLAGYGTPEYLDIGPSGQVVSSGSALSGEGPSNTPASVITDLATDVTGVDLAAGVYDVTLITDLTDAVGSTPTDFIAGVLKCDVSAAGGGTGPASIIDGIPIAVWGTRQIRVTALAPRIWFMRSSQTAKPCLIYINAMPLKWS